MKSSKPILLVEDDDVDVMTVKRALKDLKIKNQLVNTANGEEALEYLKNNDNTKPCIILLDLNMPKMNGIEFLQIVKADDTLKKIPVIVLTTSSQQQDIVESFKLSVAGYIVKSVDYAEYTEAINTINQYWTLSKIP
ncbi:MAG: response regulator [Sedimentisphaerales bacterium]|nr:response regulator [Sedimentisphaerales bacterium]